MSEPTSSETEVAFLRGQLSSLSNRLCETLTQQVAQQQTVLIAAMQANLALTQTIDRLNKMIDGLSENLEMLESQQEGDGKPHTPGADFSTLISTLAPFLIGATNKTEPVKNPNTGLTIQVPKEVADLMRNRQVAQTNPAPAVSGSTRKAQAKKKPTSKENGT